MNTITINFRCPIWLAKQIDGAALQERRTRTDIILLALEQYLCGELSQIVIGSDGETRDIVTKEQLR
jgi:hypothetical protein